MSYTLPSRRLVVCRCSIATCQLLCVASVRGEWGWPSIRMRWTCTRQVNHGLQLQPKLSVGEARGSGAYPGRIRWEAQVSGFLEDRQLSHVCHSTMSSPASSWPWPSDPSWQSICSCSLPMSSESDLLRHNSWVIKTFQWLLLVLGVQWNSSVWPGRLRVTSLLPSSSAAAPLPCPWLSFLLSFQPLSLQYLCLEHLPRAAPSHPSGQSPTMTPLSPSLLPLSKAEILPHCLPLSFWSVSCLFPPHPSLAICN